MNISPLDYTVIVCYLIFIFVLAYFSRKQVGQSDSDSIEKQYLAGKSLNLFESLFSIIATEVSALTFLGIPALAFKTDFSFVQIYMGALFGRIIIAKYFLPKMYDRGITVYSIMGIGADTPRGQQITSGVYFITKILAVGVRLFSGSILIAEFFDLNIYAAVTIISALTCVYTMIGGLKAVVRTDMIQMFVFITGGIAAHILIPHYANSNWGDMMAMASSAGKTSWISFNALSSFFVGIAGGFLFDMATHGVDQDLVQRLIATKDLKTGQRAIFLSSFLSISIGFLFLGVGALLWSFYQNVAVPAGVKPDYLFANFITDYFPSPLKGFMVAGVLAATMSTLDSTINALSSCLWVDIFRQEKDKDVTAKSRMDTILVTLALLTVACIAAQSEGLLLLGLKIASWTSGTLLCLFVARVLLPAHLKPAFSLMNVLMAYIVGIAGVYCNTFVLKWPWQWNVYFGFVISMGYLLMAPKEKVN